MYASRQYASSSQRQTALPPYLVDILKLSDGFTLYSRARSRGRLLSTEKSQWRFVRSYPVMSLHTSLYERFFWGARTSRYHDDGSEHRYSYRYTPPTSVLVGVRLTSYYVVLASHPSIIIGILAAPEGWRAGVSEGVRRFRCVGRSQTVKP